MESQQEISKLRELIHGIDVAMLTTVDEQQRLISRPMAMQKSEFDGTLYFFTCDDSPKAKQLNRNHAVNVSFSNPNKNCYVSFRGEAVVYHDRLKAEAMWNPAYKVWFPEGLNDPRLAILKVTVEDAEIWSGPGNLVTRMIGFAKGLVTGDKNLGGEHEKIAVNQ